MQPIKRCVKFRISAAIFPGRGSRRQNSIIPRHLWTRVSYMLDGAELLRSPAMRLIWRRVPDDGRAHRTSKPRRILWQGVFYGDGDPSGFESQALSPGGRSSKSTSNLRPAENVNGVGGPDEVGTTGSSRTFFRQRTWCREAYRLDVFFRATAVPMLKRRHAWPGIDMLRNEIPLGQATAD